jgi:uncharacterized metal-binding protein YceD (DUF177 family)
VRLEVEHLPENGRTVAFGLTDPWARGAAAEALEAEPAALGGSLEIAHPDRHGRIEVQARVSVEAGRECDRCGEPVAVSVNAEAPLVYLPTVALPTEADDEPLAEEDLDVGWYDGGVLDLAAVVSEAIALQLPPRIVCADTAACDARTEALLAAHAAKQPPPAGRFAGLSLPGGKSSRSNS